MQRPAAEIQAELDEVSAAISATLRGGEEVQLSGPGTGHKVRRASLDSLKLLRQELRDELAASSGVSISRTVVNVRDAS